MTQGHHHGESPKMVSKSSSLKALLMRGWRERWPASTWGIRIKTVLPRGGSGDAYNLAEILLSTSLVSPVPNALILSYLKHALGSHLVSHLSVLQAILNTPLEPRKTSCQAALLYLLQNTLQNYIKVSSGKSEECLSLANALVALSSWLLRLTLLSIEDENQNAQKALSLLNSMILSRPFVLSLFTVAKAEDKEAYSKMISLSKTLASKDAPGLKPEILRITSALKTAADNPLGGTSEKSPPDSFILASAFQPVLAFEAILHPTSDLNSLAQGLNTLALVHHLSFSELIYEVLRSMILSLSVKEEGIHLLTWDAFILVRFPALLDRLHRLMVGGSPELKTPTELYKAFDKLLKSESLCDAVDVRCKCSIIDVLLRVVAKSGTPLLTETEIEDVRKKRPPTLSNEPASLLQQEMVNARNFEMMSKAEVTIDNILQTLDSDCSKPEALENLLGVLCHIIKGESFDLLLAASSANGKLKLFIRSMAKLNTQSQESQGESIKNSCLRAALFDITFLMLVHVVQTFGSEMVIKEAKGTFIEGWIRDMLTEEDRVKYFSASSSSGEGLIVDNILSQLSGGELRTQVVKWQNVCSSVHLVMKELVIARSLGDLSKESYLVMLKTLCGRLCALPVCVLSWFSAYELSNTSSEDIRSLKKEFIEVALESGLEEGSAGGSSGGSEGASQGGDESVAGGSHHDMPHAKERVALMSSIFKRILRTQEKKRISRSNSSLKDSLLSVWEKVSRTGWLDIDSVLKIKELYRIGGAQWLTECLIDELLKVVYQEDMDRLTELVISIFHVDLEECTLSLLRVVVPAYLTSMDKSLRLTDPHGTLLAKVTVTCIFAILMGDKKSSSKSRSSHQSKNFYSPSGSDDYYHPSKQRKLEDESSSEESPLSMAVTEFFNVIQASVLDTCTVSPRMHFAVRFLEMAALRGRHRAPRLIFSRLNMNVITHLIKVVPDLFTYSLITKLFDISSSSGRKNMARTLCFLKNVKTRNEIF